MKLIQGAHKASKFAPEDFITNMPDNVVTNILNRLELQDAVRTDILSRNWRFKWTMLSELKFDMKFYWYLSKRKLEYKCGKIISWLLLHMKGSITKFELIVDEKSYLDDEDINHWMLFLSTKGVKDLTFWKMKGSPIKLPTRVFSCLELKQLQLLHCCVDLPVSFHGFPNLLSLEIGDVNFNKRKFGDLITQCPLLEVLNMSNCMGIYSKMSSQMIMMSMDFFFLRVTLVEIAKLANLKILSLFLCNLDNMMISSSTSTIFKLMDVLPKLQELDLNFLKCKFTKGVANNRYPTSFSCLKVLKLSRIDLHEGIMFSCAMELIRYFSNLQTLEITAFEHDAAPIPIINLLDSDYNTTGPLQLRNVIFRDLTGSKNEVCLIKFILACSPFLKRMVIHMSASKRMVTPQIPPIPPIQQIQLIQMSANLAFSEKEFARKLLELPRASPVAIISLC